jgi:hypothetical protein
MLKRRKMPPALAQIIVGLLRYLRDFHAERAVFGLYKLAFRDDLVVDREVDGILDTRRQRHDGFGLQFEDLRYAETAPARSKRLP